MSKSRGYIDIAAVKADTNLEQVLTHYDLLQTLKPKGASLRGCCPIHKGTNPDQFSVTLSKNLWKCFSECQHGGNHLDFVMKMEDCNSQEAAWLMNDWFGLGLEAKSSRKSPSSREERPAPSSSPKAKTSVALQNLSPSESPSASAEADEESGENTPLTFALENLDGAHPYLKERGLKPETIAHFGIGYCSKGILAGRIAIPIHNQAGELVANAGRWPGDPPEGKEKYRLPGKFKKSLELYNCHRAAEEPESSPLIVVEGFFPVISLWQLGIRRVVALMGCSLSARQEEIIARLVTPESRLILMLDNDAAGHEGRMKMASRLADHCFVHSFQWPDGIHQPEELEPAHLADLMP